MRDPVMLYCPFTSLSQKSRSPNASTSEKRVFDSVKASFRAVKKDWRRHFTPELKIKLEEQQKHDRRNLRRIHVSTFHLLLPPCCSIRVFFLTNLAVGTEIHPAPSGVG